MIVETTANQFYRVHEIADENMAHLWHGQELKKTKAGFVEKTTRAGKPVWTYVRKAGCRVVQQ